MLSFVAEDKRKWPRIGQFFVRIAFFMRGQTMKPFFYMRSCRAAPPFFPQRKGGKKRQGALPPEPPGGFVDFLSMKIDSDAGPSSRPYKKGCGPGDGLPHFFSPAPNRSPGALGPLVV